MSVSPDNQTHESKAFVNPGLTRTEKRIVEDRGQTITCQRQGQEALVSQQDASSGNGFKSLPWITMGNACEATRRIELGPGVLVFVDDAERILALAFLHRPFLTEALLRSFLDCAGAFPFDVQSTDGAVLRIERSTDVLLWLRGIVGLSADGSPCCIDYDSVVAVRTHPDAIPLKIPTPNSSTSK
jgi:hypothetical protein